jgi:hypothetical protein
VSREPHGLGGEAPSSDVGLRPLERPGSDAAHAVRVRLGDLPWAWVLHTSVGLDLCRVGSLDAAEGDDGPRGLEDAGVARALRRDGEAEGVRSAVERAWFEQCPLRIAYRDAAGVVMERLVRIGQVLMDRGETRLRCDDLDKDAPREFVMHRIEAASAVATH